jgi:DNA-binding NtrC family response regulator
LVRSRWTGATPQEDNAIPENSRLSVLVVDDEPAVREVLSMRIESWGFRVSTAADVDQARQRVAGDDPDIVITDVVLPDGSGLDLLRRLRADQDSRVILLITAHGSVDQAVEAMKAGARDFLTKPLDYAKLRSILDAATDEVRLRSTIRELEVRLDGGAGLGGLIGESERMSEVFELVKLLASSDASALITGPSGTGKEVVARTIHELSARSKAPFVAVNAAAIPEGLIESELFGHERGAFTGASRSRPGCFEQADGGTLFLDEIAEMPIELQPKLLRILEDGAARRLGGSREIRFDVRVLAATNRDPGSAVESGELREDLYYRLNVFTVHVPPLEHRKGDIPLLAQHFVRRFNEKHGTTVRGLGGAARDALLAYPWPGNVRELRNVVERATIVAGTGWIEPMHLPPYLRETPGGDHDRVVIPVGTTAAEAERMLILRTLEHVGNNKAEAARRLELDVKTIRNKLKAYETE